MNRSESICHSINDIDAALELLFQG